MTAKDYLRRIRGMELDLKTIEGEIEEIEAALTRVTPSYQTDWVNSSPDSDKMTDGICKLIAKKREYEKAWDELIDERMIAEGLIYRMDNRLHATILWQYYLKGKLFEYIALDQSISYRHLLRMHGYALSEFSKLYENVSHHVT